jgi:hypothetical protein
MRDLGGRGGAVTAAARAALAGLAAALLGAASSAAGEPSPVSGERIARFERRLEELRGTGASALLLKLPEQGLALVLLGNANGLSQPFALGAGDVLRSPFARAFLDLVAEPGRTD